MTAVADTTELVFDATNSPVLRLLQAEPHLLPRIFSFGPLAHHTGQDLTSLHRELASLEAAGLVQVKRFANGEGLVTLAR